MSLQFPPAEIQPAKGHFTLKCSPGTELEEGLPGLQTLSPVPLPPGNGDALFEAGTLPAAPQHAGYRRGSAPFPPGAKPQRHASKLHVHGTQPRGNSRRTQCLHPTLQPCASSLNFGRMRASTAFGYNFSLLRSITSFLSTIIIVILPISNSGGSCCSGALAGSRLCLQPHKSRPVHEHHRPPCPQQSPHRAVGFSSENRNRRCFHIAIRKPT